VENSKPVRNLVLCCDGTSNQFGPENTNVVRLAQLLLRDPDRQRLYYDPGVGTLPEPGVVLGTRIWTVLALAFGVDLGWKVQEAYSYLMDTWEQGDRVFLFGFSRGAYTVRVLAAMLHTLGLLPRGNNNLVPYAFRLFKGARRESRREEDSPTGWWSVCKEFRESFARQVSRDDYERRFPVHFLALWDTVSSVGWVWNPRTFHYTQHNPSARIVRHAISLDERRAFFRQNRMEQVEGQDFREFWFPGVHADVGGGYREADGGLWRGPFDWIVSEAEQAELLVDKNRQTSVLAKTSATPKPWLDDKHESLTPAWWPAEFLPKLSRDAQTQKRRLRLNLGRRRFVQKGACLHKWTLERIRESDYAPPNLSPTFLAKVKALTNVPDALAYD